ncbi:MAG TPA: hypothetical protein VM938_15990 [Acidimicrobiales bacterium]|nr:hypothetical protein [Acidimicrobiales bacterium]
MSSGERAFVPATELLSDELLAKMSPGERQASLFVHHPGADGELQLFEVRLLPDAVVEAHAHAVDEVIVVVEGEIVFGRRRYGPGSSVLVPGMTLYSFRAGPDGLTFLNFRGTADTSLVTKEELRYLQG